MRSGVASEVTRRFWAATSRGHRDVPGLTDLAALDGLLAGLGFRVRPLPPVVDRAAVSIQETIARLEAGIYAGCWDLDEEERLAAGAATRAWARERFGSMDAPHVYQQTIGWHAYDAPPDGWSAGEGGV